MTWYTGAVGSQFLFSKQLPSEFNNKQQKKTGCTDIKVSCNFKEKKIFLIP